MSLVNSLHFGAGRVLRGDGRRARRGRAGHQLGEPVLCDADRLGGAPAADQPDAFAAPARRNPNFLADIATTTVAVNKVKVYDFHRKPLPSGWVVDGAGQPVEDAAKALGLIKSGDVGGLTPLGGTLEMSNHKGHGLSMMAHIPGGDPLRRRVPGDPGARRSGVPTQHRELFLSLDPAAFRATGSFEDDLDDAIDVLHETPPLGPETRCWWPGIR
ncbi:Ldh family oxidoreductase [Saccharopolyspora spinosa]|uniref:Ldh family oxidoreductase n=1 Tax=Saccharopolyspora spinosa TaxID=60894 RepID=UPI0013052DBD|nr:Ldh family oxidoreductase [Saccharopolyspora spinosa]